MTETASRALPLATLALRVLVVLNWAFGAAIVALLAATLVAEDWTFRALGISPDSWIPSVIGGLRAIAVLGAVAIPLNDRILRHLLAIVDTVRRNDPFVYANAQRLQAIAWTLLALQVLGLVIGAIAKAISTPAHPVHVDGSSLSGWLAVLLTFILARVFAEGASMRRDLDGTV